MDLSDLGDYITRPLEAFESAVFRFWSTGDPGDLWPYIIVLGCLIAWVAYYDTTAAAKRERKLIAESNAADAAEAWAKATASGNAKATAKAFKKKLAAEAIAAERHAAWAAAKAKADAKIR